MPKRAKAETLPVRHPRYSIVKQLGHGGQGTVFLAKDKFDDDRLVALKVCRQETAQDSAFQEFRALRDLRHPGLAMSLDFGRLPEDGRAFFTMEYVSGPSLEKYAADLRQADANEAVTRLLPVFIRATETLDYVHRRGLLHLDLKPTNILLDGDVPRLVDFGLARSAVSTVIEMPRGTAYYTAPEVFDGSEVDCRADLYALGVSIYRCCTGSYPITGRNIDEIAERHRHAPPQETSLIPDSLFRITRKLLAKAPEHRFESAREVVAALEKSNPHASASASRFVFDELDFAGRRPELDQFFTWRRELQERDEQKLFLVEGQTGEGKTRFVDTCLTELRGLDIDALVVRSRQTERSGLAELVEKLALILPQPAAVQPRFHFLFTSLGLSSHADSQREMSSLDLDQIRRRRFIEILQYLEEAVHEPFVFILEDLDSSDPQLCDFVRRLLYETRPGDLPHVSLLATCQTREELGFKPPPYSLRCVRLGPLSNAELHSTLEAWNLPLDGRTIASIAKASAGNPANFAHLVRGTLAGETEDAVAARGDLRALLAEQASRLEATEQRILLTVSLASRPLDEESLSAAGGLSLDVFKSSVPGLIQSGLLLRRRSLYFLKHELLRDIVLEQSETQSVRDAHRRFGAALRNQGGATAEIATHLLRGGVMQEGLQLAAEAERALLARGKLEEALLLSGEILPHIEDRIDHAHLLEGAGDVRSKAGLFDESERCYQRLLRLTDLPQDTEARTLRKLGAVLQRRGENAESKQMFEKALQLLDDVENLDETLHILNELSALHLYQMEVAPATTFANRGLELLDSAESKNLSRETYALHSLNLHAIAGQALLRQFEYGLAADELDRSLEYAREVGDLSSTALILNNLGVAYHQSNQLEKALSTYTQAEELSRRLGDETARFSIQCNQAVIHARTGTVPTARSILAEVKRMPHWKESKRARLFYLYSSGLIDRVSLEDCREFWTESAKLAEELSDPLFSVYARAYLLENEIFHGRWGNAREILDELSRTDPRRRDLHFRQAVTCRHALLESLCGNRERARDLLDEVLPAGITPAADDNPSHGELWNRVFAGSALVEIGAFEEAKNLLEHSRTEFSRTHQSPGALECALLLADLSLRQGEIEDARIILHDAQEIFAGHEESSACAANVRLPYLEARLALSAENPDTTLVSDLLANAMGELRATSSQELVWLLDLVASKHGEPAAIAGLESSRENFLAGLHEADREHYLMRDHLARLGLSGQKNHASAPSTEGAREDLLEALSRLRNAQDIRTALQILLDATGCSRCTLEIEGLDDLEIQSKGRGKSRASSDDGGVLEVHAAPDRHFMQVKLRTPDRARSRPTARFLEIAEVLLAELLAGPDSRAQLSDETTSLAGVSEETRDLQGASMLESSAASMREIILILQRTRNSKLPVLLMGESGTGKDHVARWIHTQSSRAECPFLAFDCSAVPESLLEAELLGYEEGAFTGAETSKPGCLSAVDGGTMYLDNIDSIPLQSQVKLLRVLECGEYRRLGGRSDESVDIRFIASSQNDLAEMMARKEFRNDLYYRLAGIPIRLPPLRERTADIMPLLQWFQRQSATSPLDLRPDAMEVLRSHAWPGNVRELESLVRRLSLTVEGPIGEAEILHGLGQERRIPPIPRWIFDGRNYKEILRDVKREYLLHLFEEAGGNMPMVARALGTTRRNVYHRFAQVGLKPDELRDGRSKKTRADR